MEQTSNLLQDLGRSPKQMIVATSATAAWTPTTRAFRSSTGGECKSLSDHGKRLLKRRQAIEPLIGHTKSDHRMDRSWLQGAMGDALHALSCAAGYNIRWLLRAIARIGLDGLFYALSAVIACLTCLLHAVPARTRLAKPATSPQRRPSSNFPWLSLTVPK